MGCVKTCCFNAKLQPDQFLYFTSLTGIVFLVSAGLMKKLEQAAHSLPMTALQGNAIGSAVLCAAVSDSDGSFARWFCSISALKSRRAGSWEGRCPLRF